MLMDQNGCIISLIIFLFLLLSILTLHVLSLRCDLNAANVSISKLQNESTIESSTIKIGKIKVLEMSRISDNGKMKGGILSIISRDGWLARQPIKPAVPLTLPVSRVVVISTRTDLCTTQAACTYHVRMIQNFNIESVAYDDIIYNFLIGGDGNVYEGRGWDFTGAHLNGFNENSISFAYIGTFRTEELSPKQLNVTKLLLDEGVRTGKLAPNYEIISANKLEPISTKTLSEKLYNSFKD